MKLLESHITGGFWSDWQRVNAETAIFYQWTQLEKTGCIDNFRIIAEDKQVFRRGWFFADSDAFKWLEAAFRILSSKKDEKLKGLVDGFVDLIEKTQTPDGYLYTFNQIHFPGTRWVNLQIEHELYCHGHLIEAFVSGAQTKGYEDKLVIARKAADRIVADFMGKGPKYTPGHEEIEIALLRLYEVIGNREYLAMARQFLDMRGRQFFFPLEILQQSINNGRRVKQVEEAHQAYLETHDMQSQYKLPESNKAKKPGNIKSRWFLNALSGKLLQQHKQLRKQTKPVGHAVRFAYLMTAAAMLDRLTGEQNFTQTLEKSWTRMVNRRMYITGGIGSLPLIEGFGRDYELNPEFAYTETCAALGSLFWNREMAALTGEVCYSDLYEWQLYNAALVGMGVEGKTYFYNNPLASHGEVQRRSWYEVPCCPSNLSRTWAGLHRDVINLREDAVEISQYISSTHTIELEGEEFVLQMTSELPWGGKVQIKIEKAPGIPVLLRLRQPSWVTNCQVRINDELVQEMDAPLNTNLQPNRAAWLEISRQWRAGDQLSFDFALPVQIYHAHQKVKSVHGKAVLTRGPLVYCLESIDNPAVDIFEVEVDGSSLSAEYSPDILWGIWTIQGQSVQGEQLLFIPYYLWGNRGASQMTVFVKIKENAK